MPFATAAEKPTADKLAGTWEAVKGEKSTIPVGGLLTLTKDGKVKVTFKAEKEFVFEGTFALDSDKLTMTMDIGGSVTTKAPIVTRLTGEELSVTDDAGKSVDLKRVK